MASLRDLKKRLQSVRTTGQLAGAMRTAATAKYARASGRLGALSPYSEAFREIAELAERAVPDEPKRSRRDDEPNEEPPRTEIKAFLLISGNRGLCGGYNHELFGFFAERLKETVGEYKLYTCGRMAREYCAEKGVAVSESFDIADVPSYKEARAVSDRLLALYAEGAFASVTIVYQRFHNMLKQTPDAKRFIPLDGETERDGEPPLFIPDAETVKRELLPLSLAADMYTLLLSCSSGAQAATLLAMRSAYDNANTSAQLLETAINRRRQAQVTESVIETSSGTAGS